MRKVTKLTTHNYDKNNRFGLGFFGRIMDKPTNTEDGDTIQSGGFLCLYSENIGKQVAKERKQFNHAARRFEEFLAGFGNCNSDSRHANQAKTSPITKDSRKK